MLICCAALAAGTGPAASERQPPYESPARVRAVDYLPAELMRGPNWAVFDDAENDGLNNTYLVGSRFGVWKARSETRVVARIREIEALAELETVSRSEVFREAVENSVTAPLRLAQDVADQPVETLKGIPEGTTRWFRRTAFKVRETYHDVSEDVNELREDVEEWREERQTAREKAEDGGGEPRRDEEETDEERRSRRREEYEELEEEARELARDEALDYLRISRAERRWYGELGVDPNTDNLVLKRAIKSVARVEGLTNFGMKFIALPTIPGQSELRDIMDVVWETDPVDLLLANRERMLAAGLTIDTARAFEDSALSLTQQTAFLRALDRLEGVEGREHLFARALEAKTRDEAEALTVMTVLLARMHQGQKPLEEILTGAALPVARTRAGNLVAVFMANAVFWTEGVADQVRTFASIYANDPAEERHVYVTGVTSARFDDEAAKLGWAVVDRWRGDRAEA